MPGSYVLHLPSWYPNKYNPIEANFIQNQIRAISTFQQSIVVAIVENSNIKQSTTVKFDDMGIAVSIRYIPLRKGPTRHLLYFFAYWQIVMETIKDLGKPKLIHVHVMFRTSLLAYFLNLVYQIPYLITEHFTIFSEESRHPRKNSIVRFSKYFSRRSEKITTVSAYLKERLEIAGFKKDIEVVYNLVNTKHFNLASPNKAGKLKFLHVSNCAIHKRVEEIIETFAELKKEGFDFELTIVCGLKENLEALTNSNQVKFLGSNVSIKGPISYTEVASIMKKHDVFILNSLYETFSCVLAEAQCCGLGLVSTDIGGPSEIITDDRLGNLIPLSSENGMKIAIREILQNFKFDRNYISKKGIDRFSEFEFAGRMQTIYDQILNRNR